MLPADLIHDPPAWLALVTALLKAAVILCAAGILAALLRRASAASRHLVWTCALAAVLMLPVVSYWVPAWRIPVFTITAASSFERPVDGFQDRKALPLAFRGSTGGTVVASPTARDGSGGLLREIVGLVGPHWFTLLWLAGMSIVLSRLAAGHLAVHRAGRRAAAATNAPWFSLARSLAGDLGIARVEFRRGSDVSTPMTWGICRPVVLLPADADDWPDERLRIVLLHELAHVKRADCLTHMLAQIACAVHWPNPLAWSAARRARAERERACDDLVLAWGTAREAYASELLAMARAMKSAALSSSMARAGLAMAHRSQLEGRLMAILDPSVPRSGVSRLRTGAAVVVALVLLAPLAAVQPSIRAQSPSATPAEPRPGPEQPDPVEVEAAGPTPARQSDERSRTKTVVRIDPVRGEEIAAAVASVTESALVGTLEALPAIIDAALSGALEATAAVRDVQVEVHPEVMTEVAEALQRVEKELSGKEFDRIAAAIEKAMRKAEKELRKADIEGAIHEALRDALRDLRREARRPARETRESLRDLSSELREAIRDALRDIRIEIDRRRDAERIER